MSFNVSYEIAKYLHYERPIPEASLQSTLNTLLIYNLDKDRLELELRKYLITRLLDKEKSKFNVEQEQTLSNAIRDHYGGKFNHRFSLILQSLKDEKEIANKDPSKGEITVIPQAVWPTQFSNPLRTQVIAPQLSVFSTSFTDAYKTKFDSRRLEFLSMFGTVELLVDKKHSITVSTGQATCLLRIEEKQKVSNKDLSDYLVGTDPALMRSIITPLIDSTVVTEVLGYYQIEEPKAIESKQLSKAQLRADEYLDLIR